ncbi:MAG: carboxymuconolactone decarboxylase family protein [Spirochaetales bacterium]|nr:carboxymuconolactone decarboxylase family protein [Spirochaetales bacterium]
MPGRGEDNTVYSLFQQYVQIPIFPFRIIPAIAKNDAIGALSEKVKYLLALAVALGTGCRICILAQVTKAMDAGATKEEIMETISVVVAMRGTTGIAESLRIIDYLEEKGLI